MKKKNKNILIASFIFLAIISLYAFGVLQSITGVSSDLQYQTEWTNPDLATGNYQTEAILKLPSSTNEFSFIPSYNFETYYKSSEDVNIDIKYDIFNYNSNNYETIHSESFNLRNDFGEQNRFKMDGQLIYSNAIPERFTAIQTGRSSYDRYYGCIEGMSISQAKQLNPWTEGTSSYTYKCINPGQSLSLHDYNDDSNENWDIKYFPKLITKDFNYIQENEVKLRISVNIKTSGIDSIRHSDFRIDLFEVKTELVKYYRFLNNSCSEIQLMTFQKTINDYENLNDCREKIITTEPKLNETNETQPIPSDTTPVEPKERLCLCKIVQKINPIIIFLLGIVLLISIFLIIGGKNGKKK